MLRNVNGVHDGWWRVETAQLRGPGDEESPGRGEAGCFGEPWMLEVERRLRLEIGDCRRVT